MQKEAQEKEGNDIAPILVGFVLTAIVVLAGAALAACQWQRMAELKPNEWGDFLAGISSTLAFIWIIVAVFLQRQELQAQRYELKQSREAQQEQASELRRTADQQKLQVDIMDEQLKAAVAARRAGETSIWESKKNQLTLNKQNIEDQIFQIDALRIRLADIQNALRTQISDEFDQKRLRAIRDLNIAGRLSLVGSLPGLIFPLNTLTQQLTALANHAHQAMQNNSSGNPTLEADATSDIVKLNQDTKRLDLEITALIERLAQQANSCREENESVAAQIEKHKSTFRSSAG